MGTLYSCLHAFIHWRHRWAGLKNFIHLHHGSFGSSMQAAQCIRVKIKHTRSFYLTIWHWLWWRRWVFKSYQILFQHFSSALSRLVHRRLVGETENDENSISHLRNHNFKKWALTGLFLFISCHPSYTDKILLRPTVWVVNVIGASFTN